MRPGVEIISRSSPLARSAPTDTGVWLVAGATQKRPGNPGAGVQPAPVLINSMTEYQAQFGTRTGAGVELYDAIETYFREGGNRVYVAALPSGATGTPSEYDTALDALTSDLGPGQVSAPGSNDPAVMGLLLDHAAAHDRVALIDGPDGGLAADIIDAGQAFQSHSNARYGAAFSPAAIIPGVASGTTRLAPWSAVVAGIIARNDVSFTPNQAAAGVNGVSTYAIGLNGTYTDAEYQDINEAGICMGRVRFGTIENYGYRSLVDPAADDTWLNFGNVRLNMAIVAGAGAIAERFVFSQLDGRRKTISDFGGELSAMLVPFYEKGALYGDTADEAFRVDVGTQVNTEQTIAAGELHAVIEVRMSPFSELVVIEIVKVRTTESLAA